MISTTDPTKTMELLDSTPLLRDPGALSARADEHGVLYFRELLDPAKVLTVREQIAAIVRSAGWVADGSASNELAVDVESYRATTGVDAAFDGGSGPVYAQIQRLEKFHALAHEPRLVGVYEAILGGAVMPHPRNIARIQVPTDTNPPTPPHQDFIHIQGAADTWTAWIPLGDCPVEMGGLTVLVGSHKLGVLDYKSSAGVGAFEAFICGLDLTWMQGDYRAGDVITFQSQTVHRALTNQTDQLRLSVDYRYQRVADPITADSLEPHGRVLDWNQIYDGWEHESLKYYWRDASLQIAGFDPVVKWQKDHIC